MDTKQLSLDLQPAGKKDSGDNATISSTSNNIISFRAREMLQSDFNLKTTTNKQYSEETESDFRARIIADLIRNKVIVD